MRTKVITLLIALILLATFTLTGCISPPKKVKVPNLIAMDLENAIELIESVRLTADPLEGEEAPEFELERIVYHQDPAADTRVKRGTSVLITHYGKKPNPYTWVRGLLTLKPLPSATAFMKSRMSLSFSKQATGLGFNLIAPYAGLPSGWIAKGGKVIYTTKTVRSDETGIVAYSTCDEPDCHKHDPYKELELVRYMKTKTNLPVGTTVVGDIGCGVKGTASSKEEYQKQWIEVINQMDLVLIDVYPYRKPEVMDGRTPLEEMEYRHAFFKEHIKVPIIMVIQAHWNRPDQLQPDAMEQVKFWVSRGYGYIVYPWHNGYTGVRDRQEEWRLANEWAASQR